MATWFVMMVGSVLALVVVHTTARSPSTDSELNDQKNFFVSYDGVGGFSGLATNGLPFGRVGGAAGIGSGASVWQFN
jgi:hypothetical protein